VISACLQINHELIRFLILRKIKRILTVDGGADGTTLGAMNV